MSGGSKVSQKRLQVLQIFLDQSELYRIGQRTMWTRHIGGLPSITLPVLQLLGRRGVGRAAPVIMRYMAVLR